MKHNFLYGLADETLQKLLSNGIIRHSIKLSEYNTNLKAFETKEVQSSNHFSLNDLSYGFNLWIFAFLISYIAFMVELSWFYLYNFFCK